MKQIIFLSVTLFMLFSQKATAQCGFTLSQAMNFYSSPIQVGTTDTYAVWQVITDSCGATSSSFSFTKNGTSGDSNHTNMVLYKDATPLFTVPFMAGITTQVNYATPLPSHDTITFTLIGTVDSTAPLNQTIWFNMGITIIDSNNSIQILPFALGQTMTTTGCILKVYKNGAVLNQTISPGTQKLIGSFRAHAIGCGFNTTYAVLNNMGTCSNNALKNVVIKKGAVQMGSTIPVLGINSVVLFNDQIVGLDIYDVYADIDTSAVDTSTIIMDFNIIATSPTPGYFLLVDSIGQTMTISNPGGGPIGPCMTATTEVPTNLLLPRGVNVCLGAVVVSAQNCPIKVNSIAFGVYGTAATSDMGNVLIKKNNITPVAGAFPLMSFFQTISMNETVAPNTSDTFFVTGDLNPLALLQRTYQLDVTVNATDSSGNTYVSSILLAEKTIIAGPTAVTDIESKTISLYPNPTTGYITIEGVAGEIKITDMLGTIVIQKTVSEKERIDVSRLTAGIYFLRFNNQVVKFTRQ